MTMPSGNQGQPPAAPVTPPATPVPSGEPGEAPGAGEAPLTPGQQKYVSELVRREVQSRVDKQIDQSLGGLTKWRDEVKAATSNFDTAVAQLKASGAIPADADVSAARSKVVADAMAKAESPDASEQPGGDGAPKTLEEFQQRVTTLGEQEAQRWGMPPDAPEIAMLKRDGSPEEYLASMRAAGQAFAKRTGVMPQGEPQGTALPIDLGGGGSPRPNPIENINDPDELFKLAGFGKRG